MDGPGAVCARPPFALQLRVAASGAWKPEGLPGGRGDDRKEPLVTSEADSSVGSPSLMFSEQDNWPRYLEGQHLKLRRFLRERNLVMLTLASDPNTLGK